MYRMTNHARIRCQERHITNDRIAHALAQEPIEMTGRLFHVDRKTRTVLIVAESYIVTVYRAKKSQLRDLWYVLNNENY